MIIIDSLRRGHFISTPRRTLAALFLAALVAFAGAPDAGAASKVAPAISLTASPTTIAPNKTTKLTVKLTAKSKAVKSAPVTVQERYQGTKTWVTRAKLKTGTSGTASITTPKRIKNVEYRAVFNGSKTLTAKTSLTRVVAVKQSAKITKASTTTVTAGATITLTGTTSPALAKHAASLQILSGKTWKTVSKAKVSSKSTFTVSGKATQGGKKSYRVWVSGGTGVASAGTASKTFNVYSWYYLSDLQAAQSSRNWDGLGTVEIGGKSQSKSVGALWSYGSFGGWSDGSAQYNLSYRCSTFETTIGIPDTSGLRASWEFQVAVDDAAGTDTYVGLGHPKHLHIDVAHGFRLILNNHRLDGDPWQDYEADAVWANARLLCLTRP